MTVPGTIPYPRPPGRWPFMFSIFMFYVTQLTLSYIIGIRVGQRQQFQEQHGASGYDHKLYSGDRHGDGTLAAAQGHGGQARVRPEAISEFNKEGDDDLRRKYGDGSAAAGGLHEPPNSEAGKSSGGHTRCAAAARTTGTARCGRFLRGPGGRGCAGWSPCRLTGTARAGMHPGSAAAGGTLLGRSSQLQDWVPGTPGLVGSGVRPHLRTWRSPASLRTGMTGW